jgi:hypothetical protein
MASEHPPAPEARRTTVPGVTEWAESGMTIG